MPIVGGQQRLATPEQRNAYRVCSYPKVGIGSIDDISAAWFEVACLAFVPYSGVASRTVVAAAASIPISMCHRPSSDMVRFQPASYGKRCQRCQSRASMVSPSRLNSRNKTRIEGQNISDDSSAPREVICTIDLVCISSAVGDSGSVNCSRTSRLPNGQPERYSSQESLKCDSYHGRMVGLLDRCASSQIVFSL